MANLQPPKPYHLQPGTALDRFELLGVVGQGGFALTYLAIDKQLEREVIIKEYFPGNLAQRDPDGYTVIPTDDNSFIEGLESFYQEAQALSQLQHPNIADVISIFRDNDTAYMVMPYYAGKDLEAWLEAKGEGITEAEAFELIKPILRALDYIHSETVIHRDVKPANILMAERGSHHYPVLLDFGGARQFVADATQNYTQLLSLGYAPFEQYFKDGKQGPWTDVYASAAVLYRMITGERPPDATERKSGKALDYSKFSSDVAATLDKALAEDYKMRFQSVKEFEEAFQIALTSPQSGNQQAAIGLAGAAVAGGAGLGAAANVQGAGAGNGEQAPADDKTKKRGCLAPILITLGVLILLGAMAAAVWWFFFRAKTYTADSAAKLEQLILDAKKGSTIELSGNLIVLRTLELTRELTLVGDGQDTSRIEIQGALPLMRINTPDDISISNMSLAHTGLDTANVIEISQGNLNLENILIEGAIHNQDPNTNLGGRGILMTSTANVTLLNVTLQRNDYAAIEATDASNLTLTKSRIENNRTGLYLRGSSQSNISEGEIILNSTSGIEARDNTSISLDQSILQNNGANGLTLTGNSQATASTSLFHANKNGIVVEKASRLSLNSSTLSQNTDLGIYLLDNSQGNVQGSTFEGNYIGIVRQAPASLTETSNQFEGNQENIRGQE